MNSVLFVCLGNICRSPLAEGIAKKVADDRGIDVVIDSAGTGDWHIGEPPCAHSIKVAQLHGVDISQLRARKVTTADFEQFDLIVGLDESNIKNLKKMGARNVAKLGDFGYNGEDVPDPYFFNNFDGFESIYYMIESCIYELFDLKFKGSVDENSK